jgi:hypothetical protein
MSFKDQLDTDLDEVFFKGGEDPEFTEEWEYRPFAGDPYPLDVIPDATTEVPQPQGGDGAKVQSQYVRVLVKEADITGEVDRRDKIFGREKLHNIVQIDSDGVGLVTLVLHEAPV